MTISPCASCSRTIGDSITLRCSADVVTQPDSPSPYFEWFFGPANASLSSSGMVSNGTRNGSSYYSTLHFASLSLSHAGMYTCRLGGNERLAAKAQLVVNGKKTQLISVPLPSQNCVILLLSQSPTSLSTLRLVHLVQQ